jgi:hypothetical protein
MVGQRPHDAGHPPLQSGNAANAGANVKASLSFNTRSAKSCVVVVQTFPIIGNCTSTTGPADLSLPISAAGLRK